MHGPTEKLDSRSTRQIQKPFSQTAFWRGTIFALQISSTSVCPCFESRLPDPLALSSVPVANLWRLHPQSLATGAMPLGTMCDLSVFQWYYFKQSQGQNGELDRPSSDALLEISSHDHSVMHVCLTVASETDLV